MKLLNLLFTSLTTLSLFLSPVFANYESSAPLQTSCWAYEQDKSACLKISGECQWCDLGGIYGDFCAPNGSHNCLASSQDINCDNLDHQKCLEYPKECIYIGCSYGCPGCTFRNWTSLDSLQSEIQHSTSDYWGHDTSAGPDGGVEACAWAVNNIMSMSGIRKIGDNPNYVPSVVDALKAGRGRQIQASQAVAGDLVVACGEQHIGVCMEDHCNTIDSNSSSRRCFCWRAGFNFDNYFNCGPATYWRVDN